MSRSCRLLNIRAAFLCGFALAIHVSLLCSEVLADPQVLKGVENGGEAVTPRAVNTLVPVTGAGPNPTGTVTTDFNSIPNKTSALIPGVKRQRAYLLVRIGQVMGDA